MEVYELSRKSGGWEVVRRLKVGYEVIGRIEGKAIFLNIPAMDYCERHGVELSALRHREIKQRGPSHYRVFEITH